MPAPAKYPGFSWKCNQCRSSAKSANMNAIMLKLSDIQERMSRQD